jgi:hypothetical protein
MPLNVMTATESAWRFQRTDRAPHGKVEARIGSPRNVHKNVSRLSRGRPQGHIDRAQDDSFMSRERESAGCQGTWVPENNVLLISRAGNCTYDKRWGCAHGPVSSAIRDFARALYRPFTPALYRPFTPPLRAAGDRNHDIPPTPAAEFAPMR